MKSCRKGWQTCWALLHWAFPQRSFCWSAGSWPQPTRCCKICSLPISLPSPSSSPSLCHSHVASHWCSPHLKWRKGCLAWFFAQSAMVSVWVTFLLLCQKYQGGKAIYKKKNLFGLIVPGESPWWWGRWEAGAWSRKLRGQIFVYTQKTEKLNRK